MKEGRVQEGVTLRIITWETCSGLGSNRQDIAANLSTAGIVNGVLVFVTFAFTLPAIAMPTRGWLKLSGYMLVVNAVFSVILGLYLWILTLRTKESLSPLWNAQQPRVQDLMQTTVWKPSTMILC